MIVLWLSVAALALPLETCFGSGLQVSVESRVGRPVLGVSMVISGGAGGESPTQAGAAHLLEHLWFRSVQAGRTVDDQIVDMGAEYNAYTSHDATQ